MYLKKRLFFSEITVARHKLGALLGLENKHLWQAQQLIPGGTVIDLVSRRAAWVDCRRSETSIQREFVEMLHGDWSIGWYISPVNRFTGFFPFHVWKYLISDADDLWYSFEEQCLQNQACHRSTGTIFKTYFSTWIIYLPCVGDNAAQYSPCWNTVTV